MACAQCELNDCDCDAPDDALDEREPCGENMCHCDCGQGHVCACDCWRCGDCGQHADHCYCADEDDMAAERDYGVPADDDRDED